jgi:predicted secreted Zn-dependent protease
VAPARRARPSILKLAGPLTTALLCLGLITLLVLQLVQANELLKKQIAARDAQIASDESQVSQLQNEILDLKERWFGTPALYVPPPISNTVIEYFKVTGTTQGEIIDSLDNAGVCEKYGCAKDPANPGNIAWGLEWSDFVGNSYVCSSPRTTTLNYRQYVLLPRWSPPADGTVKIPLVEKWNALAQVIYIHEAGHVAIDKKDIAALNAQAQKLATCDALYRFWDDPHVFDKLQADQNAYHARLRADCRPEIGCIPPGWDGW